MAELPASQRRGARRRAAAQPQPAAPQRAGSPERVLLPPAPAPTAQYVPAVASGGFLFVSGHDPEARGRLAYRGRVGADLTLADARAAARLATLNALAAARTATGSLARIRRCVALTCFLDATPEVLDPSIVTDAVALLATALDVADPPVVWLRPAAGLAGGIPVEIELLLELR